jgi:hypothetical protein
MICNIALGDLEKELEDWKVPVERTYLLVTEISDATRSMYSYYPYLQISWLFTLSRCEEKGDLRLDLTHSIHRP